ncbi:MAG: hypothetical protein KKE17_03005 [Proteobacteria bacterium]|nr:hypothetical protein [Pseudomonadota bacterium]MBU1708951.1 hypothetical protein [Pseudomonadota bacterium]
MKEEKPNTTVIIFTNTYRIKGEIDLMPGSRLTDYVDEVQTFFAVTNAEVSDRSSENILFKSKFMDVNKNAVEIILPAELLE